MVDVEFTNRGMKDLFESVKYFEEGNFVWCGSGVTMRAKKDSMEVNLFLDRAGFEVYNLDEETNFGLNLQQLAVLMSRCEIGDSIKLASNHRNGVLSLVFESPSKNKYVLSQMHFLKIDGDRLVPEREYDAIVEMNSEEFADIWRDLSKLGDKVGGISITNTEVKFTSGNDMISTCIGMKQKTEDLEMISFLRNVASTYALANLNTITIAAAPLTDRVQLSLGLRLPMRLQYNLGGLGYVRFFIPQEEKHANIVFFESRMPNSEEENKLYRVEAPCKQNLQRMKERSAVGRSCNFL